MEDRILWVGRQSRKAFLHYYSATFALVLVAALVLLGYAGFVPAPFDSYIAYFLIGLSLIFLGVVEIKRILAKYTVTDTRVIKEVGIINKYTDYIPYQMVEKISSLKRWYERILGIGNVVIDTGEERFMLDSVNKPEEIEELVHKQINRITRSFSGGSSGPQRSAGNSYQNRDRQQGRRR